VTELQFLKMKVKMKFRVLRYGEIMSSVVKEIEEFHEGVADWINGKYERSGEVFDSIYAGRFDANFLLVAPTGHRINKDMVTQYIEGIYGSNPDFRIQITDVRVLSENE
jgi:hypothetical protein